MQFNTGVSEAFIEFMVSIFGKYRESIGKDVITHAILGPTAPQCDFQGWL